MSTCLSAVTPFLGSRAVMTPCPGGNPMPISDVPRCTARSKRTGQPCTQPICSGGTKCRLHGGRSRRGLAAPAWKGGRYSKALPPDLVDAYERARTDSELLALRDELALVDARLRSLLKRLAEGETS